MSNIVAQPAGWYPHPGGTPGIEMFWNGMEWETAAVRPTGGVPMPAQTVIVNQDRGRKVNHVLHFILTLCTFGMWLPVWFIVSVAKN